jgi:hypothetical protein
MSAAGRGAIQGNLPAAALALDGIGGKPLAVVDVVELDLFELLDIGCFQQVLIDSAGTFVMQVGLRDSHSMNLRAKHDALHVFSHLRYRPVRRAWQRAGSDQSSGKSCAIGNTVLPPDRMLAGADRTTVEV